VTTTVGYTGGKSARPTYETVCAGDGHTEAIRIEYDPAEITYEQLLQQFYQEHTPRRAQTQYKSAVWYHDEEQKNLAEAAVKARGGKFVDVDPAPEWHDAERYHQKYLEKQGAGQCVLL